MRDLFFVTCGHHHPQLCPPPRGSDPCSHPRELFPRLHFFVGALPPAKPTLTSAARPRGTVSVPLSETFYRSGRLCHLSEQPHEHTQAASAGLREGRPPHPHRPLQGRSHALLQPCSPHSPPCGCEPAGQQWRQKWGPSRQPVAGRAGGRACLNSGRLVAPGTDGTVKPRPWGARARGSLLRCRFAPLGPKTRQPWRSGGQGGPLGRCPHRAVTCL